MNIYVTHSRAYGYDFKTNLYLPLRESELNKKQTIILPHEHSDEHFPSIKKFKNGIINLLVAEISYPSLGEGIEIGAAHLCNIPILGLYKQGAKFSSSINAVTKDVFEYSNKEQLVKLVTTYVENAQQEKNNEEIKSRKHIHFF